MPIRTVTQARSIVPLIHESTDAINEFIGRDFRDHCHRLFAARWEEEWRQRTP